MHFKGERSSYTWFVPLVPWQTQQSGEKERPGHCGAYILPIATDKVKVLARNRCYIWHSREQARTYGMNLLEK